MSITQNGSSFTWDGTVTVTNATNITTGVATLTLTPTGGVGILPVLASGTPGLPPIIDSVTVTPIAWNATPAAPVLTIVSAGGPGVASHYTLSFQVNQGQPGVPGTFQIGGATDITLGTPVADYTLLVNTLNPTTFKYAAQAVGDTYQATVFTAATGNATTPQTLAQVTVPPQLFNWRPDVKGWAIPTGTANTHLDLRCVVNDPAAGQQVGYGWGITGAGVTVPAQPVPLIQAFGGAISNGYGTITSGQPATFYFQSIQTNLSTTDAFSVPTTGMYFTVKVDPIPGTN